ncbi:energy transducer TonB family protein [Sphingomonas canadensis]
MVRIEAAGNWTVVKGEMQCVLDRSLTTGGVPTRLQITLEPVTPTVWLRVATEGDGGKRSDGRAVMFIDGRRMAGDLHYNIFVAGKYRMREYMLNLQQHPLGEVQERLRFWTKAHGDIEMQLGGFPAAWTALQNCMGELYDGWGVKREDIERAVTRPGGSLHEFIDWADGVREFALLYWINAQGRVDECRLLMPSGVEAFDTTLCSTLQSRARFSPARDAQGRPIRTPQFDHPRLRIQITRLRGG